MNPQHYVYRITNIETRKHYYGVRSSNCPAREDLGTFYFSSSWFPGFVEEQKKFPGRFKYKVVRVCDSREQANALEKLLHGKFDVERNLNFYNLYNSRPGLDTYDKVFVHHPETHERVCIAAEKVEWFISKGYQEGFGPRVSQRGRISVYRDGENRKIAPEELERFLRAGWIQGRKKPTEFTDHTPDSRADQVKLLQGPSGRVNPNFTKSNGQSLHTRYPKLYIAVMEFSLGTDELHRSGKPREVTFKDRVNWFINGKINHCGTCDVPVQADASYCGRKCAAADPGVSEKKVGSRREKFGDKYQPDHWRPGGFASPEGNKKAREARRANNDGKHWTQEMTDKARATQLDRYGDENHHISRMNETILEKYGVTNSTHIPGVAEKISRAAQGNSSRNPDLDIRLLDDNWLMEQLQQHGRGEIQRRYPCSDNFIRVREVQCGWRKPKHTAAEIELQHFLESHGIDVEMRQRTVIGGLELDLWIPEWNVAIEYDDIYWHSAPDHDTASIQRRRLIEKETRCGVQGINLLRIREDEWRDPVKRQIWKSMLLAKTNRGGFTRIGARKCQVIVENRGGNKEIAEFLDANHMQGRVGYSWSASLRYNDQLVGVATFGKPRFSKNPGDSVELLRFCTKLNHSVPGAFSRILKTLPSGTHLISFANKSWSAGGVYAETGFKLESETHANYVWIRGDEIISRFQAQRSGLRDSGLVPVDSVTPDKGESEIMFAAGWRKMWIPGNIKYSLKV